jgi:hypothetical protein
MGVGLEKTYPLGVKNLHWARITVGALTFMKFGCSQDPCVLQHWINYLYRNTLLAKEPYYRWINSYLIIAVRVLGKKRY